MNHPCGGPLTTGCRRWDAPRARRVPAHGGAAPALLSGSPESELPRQCAIDLLDREERSGLNPDHSGAHAGEGHCGRAFRVGEIDVVTIVDLPNAESAAAMSFAGMSTGMVRVKTTPLLAVEEVDRALARKLAFRGPGQ